MKAEDIKDVKEKLSKYKKVYDAANSKAIKIKKAATTEYYSAIREGENYKKVLLEKVIPTLDRYLNSENTCDCQYRMPDDIELEITGVWIRFQADHPNDISQYIIPYEALIPYAAHV